jgi:hypothetical protein
MSGRAVLWAGLAFLVSVGGYVALHWSWFTPHS